MNASGRLPGRVAVITGGASGIGRATAELFLREGAQVVIADIDAPAGQRLQAQWGEACMFQRTDVTHEPDVRALMDAVAQRHGRLDCLFNNAGASGAHGDLEDIDTAAFQRTLNLLLGSAFMTMKHAVPLMKKQGAGSIINNASVAGLFAGYAGHAYSAAKGGLIQLTRSAAGELAAHGIRVNCICPGGIATPLWGRAFDLADEDLDQATLGAAKALARAQPIQRSGVADDVAKAALWLASEDASFVTGQSIVVDGGATIGRSWKEFHRSIQAVAVKAMPASALLKTVLGLKRKD
jgi:NAD(P)-dependent dehydrogenase (short-subunit alcohol dehydrogenase family)